MNTQSTSTRGNDATEPLFSSLDLDDLMVCHGRTFHAIDADTLLAMESKSVRLDQNRFMLDTVTRDGIAITVLIHEIGLNEDGDCVISVKVLH